jgi:hypothetical protein
MPAPPGGVVVVLTRAQWRRRACARSLPGISGVSQVDGGGQRGRTAAAGLQYSCRVRSACVARRGLGPSVSSGGTTAVAAGASGTLFLPKISSVQLMRHVGIHGALHRVGRVVVCQGWRFGQEPPEGADLRVFSERELKLRINPVGEPRSSGHRRRVRPTVLRVRRTIPSRRAPGIPAWAT